MVDRYKVLVRYTVEHSTIKDIFEESTDRAKEIAELLWRRDVKDGASVVCVDVIERVEGPRP